MDTRNVFRHEGKFYRLGQKFKGKLKPTMKGAREEYKKQWRSQSYYSPAIAPAAFFRDDYRRFKSDLGYQTVYFIGRGCLFRREANTCELNLIEPVYHINDDTRKIDDINTQTRGMYSSAMFELEPIDKFPREEGGTPNEEDNYKFIIGSFGYNGKVFIDLGGPDAVGKTNLTNHTYNMHGSGLPYSNQYTNGYTYHNGRALTKEELDIELHNETIDTSTQGPVVQTPEEHLVEAIANTQ